MADVISFDDVVRARRRAAEHDLTDRCIELVELNMRISLHWFRHGPQEERAVRARQVRHLAELLEYLAERA